MSNKVRIPLKGRDSDDNEEAKKAREQFPSMPSPKTNEAGEHAPSFIGEMHPSVVWSQSATYLIVAAKLGNMQKSLRPKLSLHLPQYQCCRSVAFEKQVRKGY